ncbi:MAG TPA: protein kinase [Acidobacteriota bacterium]|nr:protein kinase [Acidobacteriota bacterium]
MAKKDEGQRREDQAADQPTLEAGLKAAFERAPQGQLVEHLRQTLGLDTRILLRDGEDESSPLTLSVGTREESRAGRYRLQGEIARGGVGVVLKGRDDDLGRDVAIKMLKSDFEVHPAMVQRFIEEAQIGGQLQHPGILPVFELGRTGKGRLFFSMKLLRGQTLAKLLAERQTLEEGRLKLLGVFEQVCQTMAYAHAKGVVHRDLKPSNIMVGPFGEVQVVDWGLAKVLPQGGSAEERHAAAVQVEDAQVETVRSARGDSGSVIGSVMGTPAYMPPEQAQGRVEKIDERSDVFSLGAILCEILTGEPPLTGEKADVVAQAAAGDLKGAHDRLTGCGADRDLVQIACDCLRAPLSQRPRDAGKVARRVAAYRDSLDEKARQAALEAARASAKAQEEVRSRRLIQALAVTVILALALAGGGYLWLEHQRMEEVRRASSLLNRAVDQGVAELSRARASQAGAPAWTRAFAAEEPVRNLVQSSSADPESRSRARDFLGDLRSARREQAMVARLDELAFAESTFDDLDSWLRMDEEFRRAFSEFGIDFERQTPSQVAQQIRQSSISLQLAHGLDLWLRTGFYLLLQGSGRYSLQELRGRIPALLQADPDPLRVRLRRQAFQGRPALGELDQIIATLDWDAVSPRTLAILVSNLIMARDESRWPQVCRRGLRRHPDDVSLLETCAISYRRSGRPQEAVRYYTAALALKPAISGLWRSLADALRDLGRLQEAVAALRRAAQERPRLARIHYELGQALLQSGDAQAASEAFRRCLDESRASPPTGGSTPDWLKECEALAR